jgi:hypothetical protein
MSKRPTNEDKLAYLVNVLKEQAAQQGKLFKVCFSIFLVRFGNKVEVIHRESSSTDIRQLIQKYSDKSHFNPDYIIIDLFTGKSHNIRKAFATFKLNYTGSRS